MLKSQFSSKVDLTRFGNELFNYGQLSALILLFPKLKEILNGSKFQFKSANDWNNEHLKCNYWEFKLNYNIIACTFSIEW